MHHSHCLRAANVHRTGEVIASSLDTLIGAEHVHAATIINLGKKNRILTDIAYIIRDIIVHRLAGIRRTYTIVPESTNRLHNLLRWII